MRDTLHWLPIRQRIFYRVAVLVWHCFIGIAPVYLQELCRPVSTLVGRQALRSSSGGKRFVPLLVASASFLFWWQTLSSPCKHLDYEASCILNCCSFYLEFTSLVDSIVAKELHAFA